MIEIDITGADNTNTEHLRTAITNYLRSEGKVKNVVVSILNSND